MSSALVKSFRECFRAVQNDASELARGRFSTSLRKRSVIVRAGADVPIQATAKRADVHDSPRRRLADGSSLLRFGMTF